MSLVAAPSAGMPRRQLALAASRNQVLSDITAAWAMYQTAQAQAARYRNK